MNQVIAGATALILALFLWGLGKKPNKSLFAKNGQKSLEDLRIQQLTLVEASKGSFEKQKIIHQDTEIDWKFPTTAQERISLKKQLNKLIAGGPEDRLKAVVLSDQWGSKTVLPILKRALKDSDSRVMAAAATAFQKHRGLPNLATNQKEEVPRLPRNVALMR